MQASARVIDVRDGVARLACDEPAGCAACQGRRGCALRWLSPRGESTVAAPDRADDGSRLLPGASVILELDDGDLLRTVVQAYLPPLAGLIAGPLIVKYVLATGEAAALAAAVAGLAAGWAVARALLERRPARITVRLDPESHGA